MKKWLALLLAVLLVVSCFSGCGKTEEPAVQEPEVEQVQPETEQESALPHETEPVDPVPEEPDDTAVASNCVKVAMGETYTTDLDGDGQEDTVVCTYTKEDYPQKLSVVINGEERNQMDTRSWDSIQDYYYVVDLDESDVNRDIAILDEGPSSDPISVFFYYHDTILEECGTVAGFVGSYQVEIHGDSTVSAIKRMQVLQTWWGYTTWVVNENHLLEELPQEIYLPTPNSMVSVTLLQDLQAFTQMDTSSARQTLAAGTVLTLTGTDNNTWVSVTTDNNTYWVYLPDGWSIDNGGAEAIFAADIMDGLLYAD